MHLGYLQHSLVAQLAIAFFLWSVHLRIRFLNSARFGIAGFGSLVGFGLWLWGFVLRKRAWVFLLQLDLIQAEVEFPINFPTKKQQKTKNQKIIKSFVKKSRQKILQKSSTMEEETQINNNPFPFIVPQTNNLILTEQHPPKLNPFHQQMCTRILTAPAYLPTHQISPTVQVQYIREFQYMAGAENLFPILLDITNQLIYVCSKDCFVIFTQAQTSVYQKVKLPEMPTCFLASGQLLYIGLKSGSIIIYNPVSKHTLATCEDFDFSIVQLHVIDKDRFLAMDCMGNLKLMVMTIKIFMDRIVSISVTAFDIIDQCRIKKRDKLKNFVKSFPFRRDTKQKLQEDPKQPTQPKGDPSISSDTKPNDKERDKQLPRFTILKPHPENEQENGNNISMVYYYKGQLRSYTLDDKYKKIGEYSMIAEVDGKIGMLELGEGGFTNSNQSHRILAISMGNTIMYYRQIQVQQNFQYLLITQQSHKTGIHSGKFLSNNLILFLSQQGIQVANVSGPLQLIHKIQFDKFAYIDFFNQEEAFDFDKRLLYPNILQITCHAHGGSDDVIWGCLEGKRFLKGRVSSWRNYVNQMVDGAEWEKCLKSALMVYKDKITLLACIPQKLEHRNRQMHELFERITLTYISYSLKNTSDPFQQTNIVKNAIDFMVRTECFDYLSTIFQACKSYALTELFLQQIQEYVESGTIKWMGEELLTCIVKHYIEPKQDKQSKSTHQQSPTTHESNSEPQQSNKQARLPLAQHSPSQEYSAKKSQKKIQAELTTNYNRQHLQTMIMNFDLQRMQKSLLLFICLSNQLYRSMIHICTSQKDYVTPIVKLCGLRVAKNDQLVRETRKGSGVQVINHIVSQVDRLTQILFWYMFECLLGRNTEHNNTKNYLDMLQQLISFIFIPSSILMLLQASPCYTFEVLKMLCGATVMQYVLENAGTLSVKGITSTTGSSAGQGLAKQIAGCRYWYFPKDQGEAVGEDINLFSDWHSSQQFSIYNSMLSTVTKTILDNYQKQHPSASSTPILPLRDPPFKMPAPCSPQLPKMARKEPLQKQLDFYKLSQAQTSQIYLYYLHNFILNLMLTNSFPIRLGWRLLSFQFLTVYLHYGQVQVDSVMLSILDSVMLRILDSVAREYSRVGQFGIGFHCLRILLYAVQARGEQQAKLLFKTKCYILDMLNKTKLVIQTLLEACEEPTRYLVFEYVSSKIQNILSNSGEKLSISPISTIILGNLPKLMSLSPPETLKLLDSVCHKLIKSNSMDLYAILQIADQLKTNPQTQLQFIESVIKCYEELLELPPEQTPLPGTTIAKNTETLLSRHLLTLTTSFPENLETYMLRMNYPLEQAFRVCEQCGNKTAMAYVLIKSGRNLEGVLLICDLFSANSRQVLRNLARNIQNEGMSAQINKMEQQLDRVLETCVLEYSNDIGKGEQLFEKVLQKLFKQLNPKVIDNIPIQKIRQLLQLYLNKIITTTFSQVNAEFFIYKFSQNPKMIAIPTRLYLKAHELICEKLGFRYEINSIAKDLFRHADLKIHADILHANVTGVAISLQDQACQKCGVKLSEQQLSDKSPTNIRICIFQCGHFLHDTCLITRDRSLSSPSALSSSFQSTAPKQSRKKSTTTSMDKCPGCNSQWENVLHGDLGGEPVRYCSVSRERKMEILVERKNRLFDYDVIDLAVIKEEFGDWGNDKGKGKHRA